MRVGMFAVVLMAVGAIVFAQTPAPPVSPAVQLARTMCADIEKNINSLAPFTQTSCRAGGGATPDVASLLIISLSPLWDNAEARRSWLEFVVESVGEKLNADAAAKVDEIIVTDPGQLTDRLAYGIPGPLAKKIQADLKGGVIQRSDMFALIENGMVKKPINARE